MNVYPLFPLLGLVWIWAWHRTIIEECAKQHLAWLMYGSAETRMGLWGSMRCERVSGIGISMHILIDGNDYLRRLVVLYRL